MSTTINGHSPEYWDGVKEGKKHMEPSQQTREEFKKIRQELTTLNVSFNKMGGEFAVFQNEIKHISDSVDKLEDLISKNYVTKAEFNPVKFVVYGLVGTIGTGIVTYALSQMFK